MASPPFNFDEANPGDSGTVSTFPANERAVRDVVKSWINQEHEHAYGYHKFRRGDLTARNALANLVAGAIFFRTDISEIDVYNGAGWDAYGVAFPSGTKMLFAQSAAPTGWTKDVDQNDRVIRVVSGTGGATGGSWAISGLTVGDTALSVAQIPAHTHTYSKTQIGQAGVQGTGATSWGPQDQETSATGSGATHTHTLTANGTWRPAYLDVIKCTKT